MGAGLPSPAYRLLITDNINSMRIYQAKGTIFHILQNIMVPIGHLSGHQTHCEVARDEGLRAFMHQVLQKEVVPSIHPFGDKGWTTQTILRYEHLDARHTLVEAHGSPSARDWEDNLFAGFAKLVVPCIIGYYYEHHRSRLPMRLVFSLAALFWLFKSYPWEDISRGDSPGMGKFISELWARPPHNMDDFQRFVTVVLDQEECWKHDLNTVPRLVEALAYHLNRIHRSGFGPALERVANV